MIKICEYCGRQFDAKTTWQRFCSDNHRQLHFQREKQKEAPKTISSNEQPRQSGDG